MEPGPDSRVRPVGTFWSPPPALEPTGSQSRRPSRSGAGSSDSLRACLPSLSFGRQHQPHHPPLSHSREEPKASLSLCPGPCMPLWPELHVYTCTCSILLQGPAQEWDFRTGCMCVHVPPVPGLHRRRAEALALASVWLFGYQQKHLSAWPLSYSPPPPPIPDLQSFHLNPQLPNEHLVGCPWLPDNEAQGVGLSGLMAGGWACCVNEQRMGELVKW